MALCCHCSKTWCVLATGKSMHILWIMQRTRQVKLTPQAVDRWGRNSLQATGTERRNSLFLSGTMYHFGRPSSSWRQAGSHTHLVRLVLHVHSSYCWTSKAMSSQHVRQPAVGHIHCPCACFFSQVRFAQEYESGPTILYKGGITCNIFQDKVTSIFGKPNFCLLPNGNLFWSQPFQQ